MTKWTPENLPKEFDVWHHQTFNEYSLYRVDLPSRTVYSSVAKYGRTGIEYGPVSVCKYLNEGTWQTREIPPEVPLCATCQKPRENEHDYLCNGCRLCVIQH